MSGAQIIGGAEYVVWGQSDGRSWQGWMRRDADRRYWSSHWSKFWNTLERDGPKRFEDNAWISAGGGSVSFPCAVMDDFGFLVPVQRQTRI